MAVPHLDDDARRRALLAAGVSRRERAAWKLRLASGSAGLADLLDVAGRSDAVAGMRVADALGALPGVGPRSVERILEECGIARTRRLRGLGARQREKLLAGSWGRRNDA